MARIGFVTCKDLSRYFVAEQDPHFTHDDWVAAEGLRLRGHMVEPIVWGEEPKTLSEFDLLVVRSTWDYMDSPDACGALMDWLKSLYRLGLRVENHVGLMLWNLDKRYLLDLELHGVPIVPTRLIPGSAEWGLAGLESLFREMGSFVLKPARSAGARDTFLINREYTRTCLQEKNGKVVGDFSAWRQGRDFLVQPFLASVREQGEWSLVYFGREYSHAVRKLPPVDGWLVQDELGGSLRWETAPSDVRAVADRAVAALQLACPADIPEEPLYARIDVLYDRGGNPVIGEVELVEPELFFLQRAPLQQVPYQRAVDLFCTTLESRLSGSSMGSQ